MPKDARASTRSQPLSMVSGSLITRSAGTCTVVARLVRARLMRNAKKNSRATRMRERRGFLRARARARACEANANTRLRRRDLSCDRSEALALREIIARGRTRSRVVFDCGKLETTSQSTREKHRRTSCIMCKSWPAVCR